MATGTMSRRQQSHQMERSSGRNNEFNVHELERWASMAGGAALMLLGAKRGTVPGLATALIGAGLFTRGWTGHCSMYQALGLSTAGRRSPATSVPAGQGVRVDKSVTIQRSPAELFEFWHDFENLPRFMRHLKEVRSDGKRSHWVASGPLGYSVEWDAEIHHEQPYEVIGWRSLPGSEIDCAGSVHFIPANFVPQSSSYGTEVRVELKYNPPAGRFGAAIAKLFGADPEKEIEEDLHRFAELMEAGEVPTSKGHAECRQEKSRHR
jgi:uncharacterized membrane protein